MLNSQLRSIAKRLIPERYRGAAASARDRIAGYRVESYSQQGEDIILRILFDGVQAGFYVDVGAFHPARYSNTHLFYKRGWRGINIDATPGVVNAFNKYRPRDVNLEVAIAVSDKEMRLFMFKEGGLNTLSPELAEVQSARLGRNVTSSKVVRTHALREILDKYKSPGQEIHLLSVDVEGYDLEVLQSNNWKKYVPKVIVCEDLTLKNMEDLAESAVYSFLRGEGYVLYAKCLHSLIFAHASFQASDRNWSIKWRKQSPESSAL